MINKTMMAQYHKELAAAVTQTGIDQIRRSMYHLANAGISVDTSHMESESLRIAVAVMTNE